MSWIVLILFGLILAMFFILLIIVFYWESSLIFTRAPFIPVPSEVVPEIVKALDLKDGNVVYDLGCGEARVLIACAKANPAINGVGVESATLPYFLAKWVVKRENVTNLKILKQNMFKTDLHSADKIFVYLFPELMNDLLPKLQKELKPGSRVVSCDFEFEHKQPAQVIDLKRKPRERGQKLLIYEF